jgi:putative DNA primase/helicase
MTARNPRLQAALAYASRGWPVFPCNRENKQPLTEHGVKDATIDPDVIAGWWKRWPDAMIALACGRAAGVFVLDLDVEGDSDGSKLAALSGQLEEALGAPLPITWTVITPRGGRHYYFAMPAETPIGNRAGLLGKGSHIDVRGDGGYVILPPSARPDGKAYAWAEGLVPAGKDAQPAGASPELLACLSRSGKWAPERASRATADAQRSRPRPSLRFVSGTNSVGDAAVRRYALAALDGEAKRLRESVEGQRNDDLFHASIKLAQLAAVGALEEGTARAVLGSAAAQWPNLKKSRGTIESGWRKGLNEPRIEIDAVRARAEARAAARFGSIMAAPPPADIPPDRTQAEGSTPAVGGRRRHRPGKGGKLAPHDAAHQAALNGELAFYPQTDLGNAERFAARFEGRLLSCPAIGQGNQVGWLWWDGRRWATEGAQGKIKLAEHDTVRGILAEAEWLRESGKDCQVGTRSKGRSDEEAIMMSDALASWARASEDNRRLTPIAKRAAPMLEVRASDLDSDPFKINVLNGTIALVRKGREARIEFYPHDPSDRITKLAPVVYDPDARCPQYDGFLERVQPSARMRRFIDQWSGYSLTGDVSEQVLTFNHGQGKNGKSTLFNICGMVVGDYGRTIQIETFIDQGKGRGRAGGAPTPDLAALAGVRYLRTSEPERGAKLAESLIKLATGGEPMSVRFLHREFFDMQPQFKLTMSGNHKPMIRGTDEGIWRRVRLVPWGVQIPEAERVKNFDKDVLWPEASGIFNRMLAGAIDWMENGLTVPNEVIEATEQYRRESDALGRFLAECTVADPSGRIAASILHPLYIAWAKANGEREWTKNGLGRAMTARGFVSEHSGVPWWTGLNAIKTERDFVNERGEPLRPDDVKGRESIAGDEITL